jgi:transketolase
MGATHHALGDVGAMRALPDMRIYLPLVASDVSRVIDQMAEDPLPNYLRLNEPATIADVPPFSAWRRLKAGRSCVVIGMGPALQGLYELGDADLFDELEIWSVGTFPLEAIPAALAASIAAMGSVVTIEEHYLSCGLGEALSHLLLTSGIFPRRFASIAALGYPSGRYGSQSWHQTESGLKGPALVLRLRQVQSG